MAQPTLIKKFLVVGGILAAIQLVALFLMRGDEVSQSPEESINLALSKVKDVSADRKALLKVQLALADYIARNNGDPPQSLTALVGKYFQDIPIDPSTGKPFKYTVEGKRYFLGEKTTPDQTAPKGDPSGANRPSTSATLTTKELEAQRDELLTVFTEEDAQKSPPYDPSGKKDPFKPFDISPKEGILDGKTPLESYPLEKLAYSAYLESDEPKALIETTDGRGFTVKKGMKMGPNEGEITDILPNKVVIVETQTDFTGQKQTRTFELTIGQRPDSGTASRNNSHP